MKSYKTLFFLTFLAGGITFVGCSLHRANHFTVGRDPVYVGTASGVVFEISADGEGFHLAIIDGKMPADPLLVINEKGGRLEMIRTYVNGSIVTAIKDSDGDGLGDIKIIREAGLTTPKLFNIHWTQTEVNPTGQRATK